MEPHVALPMIGGLIIIVGGLLLLYKGKIAFDAAKEPVFQFESRRHGLLKITSAVLALFLLGGGLLIYPLYLVESSCKEERTAWQKEKEALEATVRQLTGAAETPKTVAIRGPVKSHIFPVVMYAACALDTLTRGADFTLRVPVFKNMGDCRIICVAGDQVVTRTVARETLLNGETLAMNLIEFPENDTRQMPEADKPPAQRTAYTTRESLPLDRLNVEELQDFLDPPSRGTPP